MPEIRDVAPSELGSYDRLESVDAVGGERDVTAFKRRARLHQSQWREARQIPPGTHPMRPSNGGVARYLGSRIEIRRAYEREENFLSDAARDAARLRIACKEPHQTLNADRLYSDLLSSMPMCFNLFGHLHSDPELATEALRTWWPDTPGHVISTRFEWSPQRALPGRYLGNRSAFDVAFELDLGGRQRGVVGVETKYHEDCRPEARPDPEKRLLRYREVTQDSGQFVQGALSSIVGTRLQQIWLDHLLALSMPLTEPSLWVWARFVLVHPAANPSYARACAEYRQLLTSDETFRVSTINSLLTAGVLPGALVAAFTERYPSLESD